MDPGVQSNSEDDEVAQSGISRPSSEGNSYFGRNQFEWSKEMPANRVRRGRENNILRQRDGPTNSARNVTVIIDSFSLFFY